MVFSSTIFLFLFLPVVLCGYYVLPPVLRNMFLLTASLFFYAWGETFYVFIMLGSILLNYGMGLALAATAGGRNTKRVLALAIVLNLGLLAAFKYANFAVDNLNGLLAHLGAAPIAIDPVHLPIGISFFTFHAMSYLMDIYRGQSRVQRNLANLGLYIALFPQLIAGPIIRYHDVADQIYARQSGWDKCLSGIHRFVIGLGKKVIIANTVAYPADAIFSLGAHDLTTGLAWLGIICYTLQIYYDFSGYSDMAIGLGRMFGFEFMENFQWPYSSQSIREFWRRWHISLSTWFRDYLYVPLGGNRVGPLRTHANLVIVFVLCGLWHGASWTFVLWGLYHGVFLVLERTRVGGWIDRMPRPARHAYVLLAVMVGWVLFRAETLGYSLHFLQAMSGFAPGNPGAHPVPMYLDNLVAIVIVVGALGAWPVVPWTAKWMEHRLTSSGNQVSRRGGLALTLAHMGVTAVVLLLCSMLLASQTHNPFIYFRF